MSQAAEAWGREGRVVRRLRHGTVMVCDAETRCVYPFYRGAGMELRAHEPVRFTTDATDTVVSELVRTEPPRERRARVPLAEVVRYGLQLARVR